MCLVIAHIGRCLYTRMRIVFALHIIRINIVYALENDNALLLDLGLKQRDSTLRHTSNDK